MFHLDVCGKELYLVYGCSCSYVHMPASFCPCTVPRILWVLHTAGDVWTPGVTAEGGTGRRAAVDVFLWEHFYHINASTYAVDRCLSNTYVAATLH